MRNFVEYHIQEGAFHTFKVDAGQNIKIGQMVAITGDRAVSVAGAGDNAIGVVYSGTVGLDGLNDGYEGDNGDVVTVIVLKPLVYLEAGGAITAGADLASGANGTVVAGDGTAPKVGTAVAGATSGERFLAILG
jgi:hypothetical protein